MGQGRRRCARVWIRHDEPVEGRSACRFVGGQGPEDPAAEREDIPFPEGEVGLEPVGPPDEALGAGHLPSAGSTSSGVGAASSATPARKALARATASAFEAADVPEVVDLDEIAALEDGQLGLFAGVAGRDLRERRLLAHLHQVDAQGGRGALHLVGVEGQLRLVPGVGLEAQPDEPELEEELGPAVDLVEEVLAGERPQRPGLGPPGGESRLGDRGRSRTAV